MILKFKQFNESKVSPEEMPILYKDDNIEVRVVKTFKAAKEQGKNTNWCSNSPNGFYSHFLTSNMYRFNFKDGFKLRLTWDYIEYSASELGTYSGGTHWGQGGIVDGKKIYYEHIRPKDQNDPFEFDYKKSDNRREMVDRILSIPDDAKLAVFEYQENNSKHKTGLLNSLYKEIEQIKVIGVEKGVDGGWEDLVIDINVEYLSKKYEINLSFYNSGRFSFILRELDKKFKNRYHGIGSVMSRYLYDKTMEFLKKKNNTELLADIKYAIKGESDSDED